MSEKTGADRYFAERMKDPEYAKHYYEATISEQAARIEALEAERDEARAAILEWWQDPDSPPVEASRIASLLSEEEA